MAVAPVSVPSAPAAEAAAVNAPDAAPAAGAADVEPLRWTCLRFADLGVDRLYEVLALRCRVFILEQGPYLDPDGADRQSAHLLGTGADGALHAYLRIVDPGVKYAEPSIGRVITSAPARGRGLGHQLVAEGVARCQAAWPGQAIRISAQAHLAPFYARHGFVAEGDPYLEDGIPHQAMVRPAVPPPGQAR